MAQLSINGMAQPELPLAGGATGQLLTFGIAPSREHFAAFHGGLIYEVGKLQGRLLWQARIRVAVTDGAIIDSRIFVYEDIAEAKAWLQLRAKLFAAEARS